MVDPGPATKKVITKSSKLIVIAINILERRAGAMEGITTLVSDWRSVAPKSRAASIIEKSNSSRRAETKRRTKGRLNVVWATKIENIPRGILTAEKKINIEIPIITSGRTIGKKLITWM